MGRFLYWGLTHFKPMARKITFEILDAKAYAKRVDKANRYSQSDRGFNTTQVKVRSDRPSPISLWGDPRVVVSWQRVTGGPETSLKGYQKRMRDNTPLPYRKHGYESHYFAPTGSTFRAIRVRKAIGIARTAKRRRVVAITNVALGTGGLAARMFGTA
jgi:hypothetical protein